MLRRWILLTGSEQEMRSPSTKITSLKGRSQNFRVTSADLQRKNSLINILEKNYELVQVVPKKQPKAPHRSDIYEGEIILVTNSR
jgi:hypothetical protein